MLLKIIDNISFFLLSVHYTNFTYAYCPYNYFNIHKATINNEKNTHKVEF